MFGCAGTGIMLLILREALEVHWYVDKLATKMKSGSIDTPHHASHSQSVRSTANSDCTVPQRPDTGALDSEDDSDSRITLS